MKLFVQTKKSVIVELCEFLICNIYLYKTCIIQWLSHEYQYCNSVLYFRYKSYVKFIKNILILENSKMELFLYISALANIYFIKVT